MKKKILGLLVLLTAICPALVNADQHYLGLDKCAEKENSDGIMICDDGNLNEGDTISVNLPVYTSYNLFDIVLATEYDHNVLELIQIPKSENGPITNKKELYNNDGINVSSYTFNGSEEDFGISSLGYVFKVKNASVNETAIKFKSNMDIIANGNDGELTIKINKKDSTNNDGSIDNSVHTSDNTNSSSGEDSILNNEILLISAISLNAILAIVVIVLLIKRK